jgi:hypothetical protein
MGDVFGIGVLADPLDLLTRGKGPDRSTTGTLARGEQKMQLCGIGVLRL